MRLDEGLKRHFGFSGFRPLQKEAVAALLAGRDAVVLLPTGGGKSLCYQLPALLLPGTTLVVSPLIALMKDQVDALRARGVAARFLNSSLGLAESRQVWSEALRGDLKLLYVAPERIAASGFDLLLERLEVSLVAVDEAHCISQWGHEFRPDYRTLGGLREALPEAPFAALTATATRGVRRDIANQLRLKRPEFFVASFDRPNLTYEVVPKRGALETLVRLLRKQEGESALIYCLSRKQTETLAAQLRGAGFRARPYHAGLDAARRREEQDRFRSGEIQVITATVAFGMGIDMPRLRLVAHHSLPKSVESYFQETGRAGRDGGPSRCVLFFSHGDRIAQEHFFRELQDPRERRAAEARLARMVEYCNLTSCRRRFLLEYFADPAAAGTGNCGGCDNCLDGRKTDDRDLEEYDATDISLKFLSAVVRTGQRFGTRHIVAVLRGSQAKKILDRGHDRLSVHGIASDASADELAGLAEALLQRGLLVRRGSEFPTLGLSPAGRSFLRTRTPLMLQRPRALRSPASPEGGATKLDDDLLRALKDLRRRIAAERGVPAYIVFPDRTLTAMAAAEPRDDTEFLDLPGVGPAKLESYGPAFLEEIAKFHSDAPPQAQGAKSEPGPPAATGPAEAGKPKQNGAGMKKSAAERVRSRLARGLSLEQIAAELGIQPGTVIGHITQLVAGTEPCRLDHLLPGADRTARIRDGLDRLGIWPLRPVKELLGDEVSYDEIRLVRAAMVMERRGAGAKAARDGSGYRQTAALLVIGNELLAGKVADTNTGKLARLLREKGIELRRVVTIRDSVERIAAETAALAERHDVVFTSGGIGGTHDDVTMEGVARAFGTSVVHHPRFLTAIRERGLENSHRGLARVPAGCELRGGTPGGSWPVPVMRNVWILPGLPSAFDDKIEVLAGCLPEGPAFHTDFEFVPGPEEALIPLLDRVVAAHPEVQIGSYPGPEGTRITFDGDDGGAVNRAAAAFRHALQGASTGV